ncbi:unannotated protein [freshwater metagenome]|uniref:Unannotated protein n=1 Tax=freshwater metagenome TaxID=449393 RepID=A0A6J6YHD3_9ZZZZ|nr:hypothetical protein [Actinomycetota bacterium]MSZ64618.1 hypothetical protein [Actinomycetota bacterium]
MKTSLTTSKALAVGVSLLLLLTACGGKSASSSTTTEEGKALTETVEAAPQATGGFDAPVVTPDKVSYTLSSPSHFVTGKFAAGQLPGQINEKFTVAINNNSAAALDLATLIVKGSTAAGICVDIFDGDNSMAGAPTDPLAVGASSSFGWGLSCPGKAGDDFTVVLSNAGVNFVEVTGKLA